MQKQKFTLTNSLDKNFVNATFLLKIRSFIELISRKIFSVGVNFLVFHTVHNVPWSFSFVHSNTFFKSILFDEVSLLDKIDFN